MCEQGRWIGRREAKRLGIYEPTRLRPNEWSSIEIQILDISGTGFRALCEARLRRWSRVSVDLPGVGSVEAEVAWQRGAEFGANFKDSFDVSQCDWLAASPEARLSKMLVQRAAAQQQGNEEEERLLRKQIADSLPIHILPKR